MKYLIVPVDFSPASANALRFGTYLAAIAKMDLLALHIYDANFSLAQAVSTGALRAEKARLEGLLKSFTQKHALPVLATFQGNMDSPPVIRHEVWGGVPGPSLSRAAEANGVALIVMGGVGTGSGATPPRLFGSVARSVARHADCPVLLLPPGASFPNRHRLTIAYAKAEDIGRMAKGLHPLISALHPEVNFVHVPTASSDTEAANDNTSVGETFAEHFPSRTFRHHRLPRGPVVGQLLEYIAEETTDFLVIGREERSFIADLFRSGSLGKTINRCPVPLVVIPLELTEPA